MQTINLSLFLLQFQIFDTRIRLLNGDHCGDGTVRVPNYERCPTYERCITYQDTGIVNFSYSYSS